MILRFRILVLFVMLTNITIAQQRKTSTFGEPTAAEFAMTNYPKDPEASAVVLFESANIYVDVVGDYIMLIKEYYTKTKVFNAKTYDNTVKSIKYYNDGKDGENVRDVTVLTHNGPVKTYIIPSQIYDVDLSANYREKKFTFANVQDGSILEYKYRVESPYFGSLGGWIFQNDVPTIYSELHTELPGNYRYKRALHGYLPLYINKSDVKKKCFSLPGYAVSGDCDRATYAMMDVPAFTEEPYMLGGRDVRPRVTYEMIEITSINGGKTSFTRSWDEIDTFFKYDKDVGSQIKNNSLFEKNLPSSILEIKDDLERAKAVYYFIQNHFKWNGNYRLTSQIRVKDAFNEKTGNNSEINLALINALHVANIETKIALISTRANGLPTQNYPVISDFNFIIAAATINNEDYFLDATDKLAPFGILPFRDLNLFARIMDFKKGSYWKNIIPTNKNVHYANGFLEAHADGNFTGKVSQIATGYVGMNEREKYKDLTRAESNQKKQRNNETIDITNFTIENQKELDKPYNHKYDVIVTPEVISNNTYLYPFFTSHYIDENPFKAEKRLNTMDFGYPFTNTYVVTIDLKDVYKVTELPENKNVKLAEGDGELSVSYDVSGSKINVRLNMKLNAHTFPVEAYPFLKEFFTNFIKFQNEEAIVLTKL